MVEVVGVRFREAGHIYYFAPGKSEYIYNEKVLVESQQSKQLATVAIPKKTVDSDDLPEDLKPILNKATANDLEKEQQALSFDLLMVYYRQLLEESVATQQAKKITEEQAERLALILKARQKWTANVSWQNVCEQLVIQMIHPKS